MKQTSKTIRKTSAQTLPHQLRITPPHTQQF